MIGLFQVMPVTPMPLLAAPPITPATAVPWPVTSDVLLLFETKFQPAVMRAARSGRVPSTPEFNHGHRSR